MYTIFVTRKLPDSWVNTLLLFNKYITQVWLAWRQAEPFWLIADSLSLLPSSAWLKLYIRAFSWANPSLRSYLTAGPRCSLLDQLQQEISVYAGLSWRSLTCLTESWILSSVDWAWILPLWSARVRNSRRRHYLVNSPSPTMKSSNSMSGIWVRNSRSRPYHVNLTTKGPNMKQPNI